jgi:hypothetical protein
VPAASASRRKPAATTAISPRASEITLDVEQILYEINTLLNAASLIHRIKADDR